ncbi:MAG: hypothetical protein CL878_03610 [Dehalococcoidia bacterium]|nr:hypothetical protein [Dehalococcoidia bacterium]
MDRLTPLVCYVLHQQERFGMSDGQFAREVLGLSPAYYSYLKRGGRQGKGGKFIASVVARFPDAAFLLPPATSNRKPNQGDIRSTSCRVDEKDE